MHPRPLFNVEIGGGYEWWEHTRLYEQAADATLIQDIERRIEAPPQGDQAPQALDPRAIKPRENQLVEAVTQHDPDDERASKQAVHAPDPCESG